MALELRLKAFPKQREVWSGKEEHCVQKQRIAESSERSLLLKHSGLRQEGLDVAGFSFWTDDKYSGKVE